MTAFNISLMDYTKIGKAIAGLLNLKPNKEGKYPTTYGPKTAEGLTASIIGTIRYDDSYITEFANFADFIRAVCFKSFGYWFINSSEKPTSGKEAAEKGMTSAELYKYYLTSEYFKPFNA